MKIWVKAGNPDNIGITWSKLYVFEPRPVRIDRSAVRCTTVVVLGPTNIELTEDSHQGVFVYPNPSGTGLLVQTNDNRLLVVYDVTGREIARTRINEPRTNLTLVNHGLLFYVFRTDNGLTSRGKLWLAVIN